MNAVWWKTSQFRTFSASKRAMSGDYDRRSSYKMSRSKKRLSTRTPAHKSNRLWLLDFSPDQVHDLPLQGVSLKAVQHIDEGVSTDWTHSTLSNIFFKGTLAIFSFYDESALWRFPVGLPQAYLWMYCLAYWTEVSGEYYAGRPFWSLYVLVFDAKVCIHPQTQGRLVYLQTINTGSHGLISEIMNLR